MKKHMRGMRVLCILIAILLAVQTGVNLSGSGRLDSYAASNGDFTFTITNGEATITGYDGSETELVIPSSVTDGTNTYSVTSIGYYAFCECGSLTSITIPTSVISLEDSCFWGCSSLTSITIPNGVTSIGAYAFCNCNGLTSITIPDSVISIGDDALNSCTSLTSITIPSSVTSIGDAAFGCCYSLTSIIIGNGNTEYSSLDGVLYNYDKSILIQCPSGKLNAFTIPVGVTSIGHNAFEECYNLTSITIPTSVTSIENEAFGYCSSLTNITIPDGVISIGQGVFEECNSLTNITIPASVTSIGYGALNSGSSLISIIVASGNTEYSSLDGVLYNYDKSILIQYIGGKSGAFTIPNGVTSIGYGAFHYCTSLTSITIPNSVTSIGEYAFRLCSSLTSISLPTSVTSIGYSAFEDCSSLKSAYFMGNAPTLDEYAFDSCADAFAVYYLAGNTGFTNPWYGYPTDTFTIDGKYNITFNSQGGSTIGSVLTDYNTTITAPIAPTKTGYTFGGWFKEASCTNAWNFTTDKVTAPTTLYAKWTANTYAVKFNANGGAGTMSSQIMTYDTAKALQTNSFTKVGYTFLGWSKTSIGALAYSNVATVKNLTTTNGGVVNLYALWAPNTYTIKFNSNGGTSGTMASLAMTYDSTKSLTTNTFKKTGYFFLGWATSSTGAVIYKDKTSVKNLTTTNKATVNLYAKWGVPITSAASYNYTSIKVSWAATGGATSYKVYRATSASGTYSLVYTAASTARSWVNTGLVTGKIYYYKVYPVDGGTTYTNSIYKYAKPIPATPTTTLTKYTTTSIKVTWTGVSGATKYQIYRATSSTGTYSLVYTASSTLRSWTNSGLTTGKTYYYKVRAYHLEGTTKVYGSCSAVKYFKM